MVETKLKFKIKLKPISKCIVHIISWRNMYRNKGVYYNYRTSVKM